MTPAGEGGRSPRWRRVAPAVGALGVVYGDIGTSPLYALRECFVGALGVEPDHAGVYGVLSLITWSLIVVVAFKYVLIILRADNDGEGGVLALAQRVVPDDIEAWSIKHWTLVGIGLFGAALLFGDGIITPALSVLSAVEGLHLAAPGLDPFIVPITIAILAGLFSIQRFGTGHVGRLFGPVMLLWFGTLGALGAYQIAQHPDVLMGLHPRHAVAFFGEHGLAGTLILGAVFLAVTGAEALYADLGHFGRGPIQRSWFALVFPALLLNYFGQGALLLREPELVDNVFYHLVPPWALYPLLALATVATIIASQAVISGVFSLTSQAVQLGYFPRAEIRHTNSSRRGQIYVPSANRFLLVGTLVLVLTFRSSGALADAYGIAVSLTMAITTLLLYFVMREVWRLPLVVALALAVALLCVDVAFFASIVRKVASGGWIPLSIAALLVLVMGVWRRGRQLVERHRPVVRVKDVRRPDGGSLVFLVREPSQVPRSVASPQEVIAQQFANLGEWQEELGRLIADIRSSGNAPLYCQAVHARDIADTFFLSQVRLAALHLGVPPPAVPPELPARLQETQALARRFDLPELELRSRLVESDVADLVGDRVRAVEIASAVRETAATLRYADVVRIADKAIASSLTERIQKDVRRMGAEGVGVFIAEMSDQDLDHYARDTLEMMRLPEDRLSVVRDGIECQRALARLQRDWCRHLELREDGAHLESRRTLWLQAPDQIAVCNLLDRRSGIGTRDSEAVLTTFRRFHCDGCTHRAPGSDPSHGAS